LAYGGDVEVSVDLKIVNPLASMTGSIPAERIALAPATPKIPSGGQIEVNVTATVPSGTTSGTYLGLIRSDDAPGLIVIVEVDVT
jgi:hypothetical protein